ncbi:MAG: polysaccharide deacetylase family protein [Planctomycetia bacterium]|nr:polysaccharide deacetylase family protein [Planctomycetia bacterium]
MTPSRSQSRRAFLQTAGAGALAALAPRLATGDPQTAQAAAGKQASIAFTLDLEMSRNFPRWEDTHWDYEKGNLNEESKAYAVEACRRVKAAGGIAHVFCVGRVCEQENLDWLRGIADEGHHVGNHTYDHVNVLAQKPEHAQYRFQRAPWLVAGKSVEQVIADNIRLTTVALKERTGIKADGFRTPGGFNDGLVDRPDVQKLILAQGFTWVSAKYPKHALGDMEHEPGDDVYADIVAKQPAAQPFVYETGLVEVPMSPVSDLSAFRAGRWKLDWFLKAVRQGVEWAIENDAVYDFLGHPSCLYVTDPQFRTVDMICQLVKESSGQARLVDLTTIAGRVAGRGQ